MTCLYSFGVGGGKCECNHCPCFGRKGILWNISHFGFAWSSWKQDFDEYLLSCFYRTQLSRLRLTISWYKSWMEQSMSGVGASKRYYRSVFLGLNPSGGFKFPSVTASVSDFMMIDFFLLDYISLEQMLYWQCHLPCVRLELLWTKSPFTRYGTQ